MEMMQRKCRVALVAMFAIAVFTFDDPQPARGADDAAKSTENVAAAAEAGGKKMSPLDRVNTTEKGKLKNEFSPTPEIIEEGKALYAEKTCGACHGPAGGGIHCPSLVNDSWVYGGDDDTIFRLIAAGSEELAKAGYARGDKEMIAGPMPGMSEVIGEEEKLWKIIAYIRSLAPAGAK